MGNIMERESFEIHRPLGTQYSTRTGLTKKRSVNKYDSKGSIQPLSGYEILQLAEGDRKRLHKNIFTKFELKLDDIVVHKSKRYEVHVIEDWDDGNCITYYKARAVLIDVERD